MQSSPSPQELTSLTKLIINIPLYDHSFTIAVNCGGLAPPENGAVVVPLTTYQQVATYSCNINFQLANGPDMRTCQANGTWSEQAPSCESKLSSHKTVYF